MQAWVQYEPDLSHGGAIRKPALPNTRGGQGEYQGVFITFIVIINLTATSTRKAGFRYHDLGFGGRDILPFTHRIASHRTRLVGSG
jgi:hypothetical protein